MIKLLPCHMGIEWEGQSLLAGLSGMRKITTDTEGKPPEHGLFM